MFITVRPLALAATLLVVCACESVSPPTPRLAPVHLYLTDAPSDKIASAMVRISAAYLVSADDEDNGQDGNRHVLFDDEAREYDLLTLRDDVRALLASAEIPEGEYSQLRLVVEQAEITLADGHTFADGSNSRTLFVPSGMQSGIKVNFPSALSIDGETSVVVDFDVDRNFVFQGNEDAPSDVLFTPLLHGAIVQE